MASLARDAELPAKLPRGRAANYKSFIHYRALFSTCQFLPKKGRRPMNPYDCYVCLRQITGSNLSRTAKAGQGGLLVRLSKPAHISLRS